MITTLIKDVYHFVETQEELSVPLTVSFGKRKEPPALRLSKMGPICPKHLWHSIHTPELAEAMPAEALIKFSFGHMIEAMAIALAKASGHEVTGEQDELLVDGIKGHRDCVIDGCVVDVKSCSSIMFKKFQTKAIREDDPFGYLDQLDGYMVGSFDDDIVRVKDKAYIWAIDKTLGKMVLYEHVLREENIRRRIKDHKKIVSLVQPPHCECRTIPDGESGNYKLDTKASYSSFKHICFPGLRTFLYGKERPEIRHLSRVVRLPNVPELTKLASRSLNGD